MTAPDSKELAETKWYAISEEDALVLLDSTKHGLTQAEAAARLARFGPNHVPEQKSRSPLLRFLSQFHNILVYVLLAAAGFTLLLQHWVDCAVIIAVVIINALIGFFQEGKAEQALAAIKKLLSPTAVVMRSDNKSTIAAEQLVPGDIVLLQAGDKVPADLRLIYCKNLQIDEALLTGESVPDSKHVSSDPENATLADRLCMAYSGTSITYGQATGLVVATGQMTELGRISAMLANVEKLNTPLLRQMARFGRWLTVWIFGLSVATVGFGVAVRNFPLTDMLLAAVGLAVAAIPEGLPAIMTITLAIGVQRMATRHAIIRHLPAVETLGALSVICTDKTGTLTQNEMTVQVVATREETFEATGVGYRPRGEILLNDHPIDFDTQLTLKRLCQAAALCNDATLHTYKTHDHPQWSIQGDPTEAAMLTLAAKAGMDLRHLTLSNPRLDVIPFESELRYMATLHHDHYGHGFIYVKGAPERVVGLCVSEMVGDQQEPLDKRFWDNLVDSFAAEGLRVLAVATKSVDPTKTTLRFDDVAKLCLLGIIGMMDPPRPEAIHAVRQCRSAGIAVKMITGDHAATALAIAQQLNMSDNTRSLTGLEIESMTEGELSDALAEVDVFARASPEHKLRLVTALQAKDRIVAMTGDGVNDAPALRRADVGVAMGQKGTEVAKEASDMVLADDNFASIANAVEEGRTVYDNLRKSILFILPTSAGEAFTIVLAILLGQTLPITAVQILWVNMITTVTLALALAFEPAEGDIMRRSPRAADESMLSGLLVWRIVFVTGIVVSGTFGIFLWALNQSGEITYARTAAVNTLVMFEIVYLFSARHLNQPAFRIASFTGNPYVWYAVGILLVFQLLFTYATPFQVLFATEGLNLLTWLYILPVACSVYFLVEIDKFVGRQIRRPVGYTP